MQITAKTFEKAILYATKAHQGQFRKGTGTPYITHPLSVAFTVLKVKKSSNPYLLASAAVLHDVVEDCFREKSEREKMEDIAKEFGYAIASLVQELTLDKDKYKEVGKTKYLIQEMQGMSSYALAIKLADRYHNMNEFEGMSKDFQDNYTKETEDILLALQDGQRKLTKSHYRLIQMIRSLLPSRRTNRRGGRVPL